MMVYPVQRGCCFHPKNDIPQVGEMKKNFNMLSLAMLEVSNSKVYITNKTNKISLWVISYMLIKKS